MKLLFISREYPPETGFGGIGSYVASIGPALRARDHEVHVLSCARGQARRDYEDDGVWIHRRPLRGPRGLGRFLGLPGTYARITSALSCWLEARRLGIQFDVVEIPDYLAEGLFLAVGRASPTVAFLHTPMRIIEGYAGRLNRIDRWLADRLERIAVRRAEIVTSPTQRLVGVLPRDWLGDHEPRIIRLPIDYERWSETAPVRASSPVVAHTGRLEARKAPEILVEAAASLASNMDIEVWFIGASGGTRNGLSYREWLTQRANELASPCRFVGQVARDELPTWLSQIRVVAIPSRDDNFPMAGVEALAAGRPVVCTSAVGLSEILAGSEAGAVVPPDDPEALAAALRPYLEDPELAARAGEAARQLVRTECAAHVVAAQREAVYQQAIARAVDS